MITDPFQNSYFSGGQPARTASLRISPFGVIAGPEPDNGHAGAVQVRNNELCRSLIIPRIELRVDKAFMKVVLARAARGALEAQRTVIWCPKYRVERQIFPESLHESRSKLPGQGLAASNNVPDPVVSQTANFHVRQQWKESAHRSKDCGCPHRSHDFNILSSSLAVLDGYDRARRS
ncbi:hypothetical protein [Bradyrhizobium sp. DASA03007]|uniref:hypothetical protein n=1 Tax=unclassified Bradyrhizobium TaxID=2631580 RepID=UPI003F716B21